MNATPSLTTERYDRRLPVFAVIGAIAAAAPGIYSYDIYGLGLSFVFTIVAIVVLVGIAVREKGRLLLSVLSVTIVFIATFFALFANQDFLHPTLRWSIEAPLRKIQLHDGPLIDSDRFTHVEWDGWGFVGSETTEYLVFDPSDSLASAAALEEHRGRGVPCTFYRVRMLEPSYYAITFYANTEWDHCDEF